MTGFWKKYWCKKSIELLAKLSIQLLSLPVSSFNNNGKPEQYDFQLTFTMFHISLTLSERQYSGTLTWDNNCPYVVTERFYL